MEDGSSPAATPGDREAHEPGTFVEVEDCTADRTAASEPPHERARRATPSPVPGGHVRASSMASTLSRQNSFESLFTSHHSSSGPPYNPELRLSLYLTHYELGGPFEAADPTTASTAMWINDAGYRS